MNTNSVKALFKISGIYAIRNTITDKLYIGSAVHIGNRLHNHRKRLRKNIHPNRYLQLAWNKYWEQSFEFVILEYVESNSLLLHCEDSWIEQTKCYDKNYGYNSRRIANSNLGLKFSEETKLKQSLAGKGHSRNKGNSPSAETRLKLSIANKGKKRSPEQLARMSAARIGEVRTEEQKAKISKTLTGRKHGRTMTDKHKAAITAKSRKPDKWPHGVKCDCLDCKELKREMRSDRYRAFGV